MAFDARRFARSFFFAGRGVVLVARYQQNFRVHLAAAVAAVVLGVAVRLGPVEWAILAFSIGLVLTAEALNTALEAACDAITRESHPLIRLAKDASAGAVLLSALSAVAVGVALFGPPLLRLIAGR